MENINSLEDIATLFIRCRKERLAKIASLFKKDITFYINANYIYNDFQKMVVNPYFLYITMLPSDVVAVDSILRVDIKSDKIVLTIYSDYDQIGGIMYEESGLESRNITLLPLAMLELDYNHMDYNLIDDYTKMLLDRLRVEKDDWELLQIYDTIDATRLGFEAMMASINRKRDSQLDERYLEAIFMKSVIERGFTIAYTPIIASGRNSGFIHYSQNNKNIEPGSLILMDCGAKNPYGYCADITHTVPANEFSQTQLEIYSIVKRAQDACVKFIETKLSGSLPVTLIELDAICVNLFIEEFSKFKLESNYPEWSAGIRSCSVISNESISFIKRFYTHFIGHHVGLEVHDPSEKGELGIRSVFTIEPGLYFQEQSLTFPIPDIYLEVGGIRLEDMYTILSVDGYQKLECLSNNIYK